MANSADNNRAEKNPRHLILILGDQLDHDAAVFKDFDPQKDAIWMAEVHEELTYVWTHKLRIAFFLSCMRHFRDEMREKGLRVFYHELTHRKSDDRGENLREVLRKDVNKLRPERLKVVLPGDHRVLQDLKQQADELDLPLGILPDHHFYLSRKDFQEFTEDRNGVILETFYRWMRKKNGILMEDGKPAGGDWNFDKQNRDTYKGDGPEHIKNPRSFTPDDTTRQVLGMVEKRYGDHPGTLEHFDLPVTRSQALALLRDFVEHRLHDFGQFQDAMWTEEAFLNHSRLSCVLNNKLLNPREAVEKVEKAYEEGRAPINSVEGFVRQVLGWREFVRGLYWKHMPDYARMNELHAHHDLPHFFWDGKTDMECMRQCMQQLINHGYAHHIQRLMVLGLFSLIYGVDPYKFHQWHLAMYVDAVDWVSLPNALGMSQYGDDGIIGTKPYCASGNYINKMSNYCRNCRYNHRQATGENACPFTTFYWDFLDRHREKFADNGRMNFQMKNLAKKSENELEEIRERAHELRGA